MSNILRDESNEPLLDESAAPGDKLLDETTPTFSAQEVHDSDTTYIRRRREK